MEKTSYFMWLKRKYNSISHLQPPTNTNPCHDSWEEQAFAVDAAGLIGGCVWPPCSYSCSFCRREFRSAQALGGHMNVHRRDRARLNRSPYPHTDEILHKHHDRQDHIPNTSTSLGCNPNHSESDRVVFPASRVFSPTRLAQENCDQLRIFLPTIYPPNSIESIDNLGIQLTPSSRSNLVTGMFIHAADPNNIEEIMKSTSKLVGPKGGANKEDHVHVKADLSIKNLNMVFCQIRQAGDGEEEEEGVSCKRRRTTDSNFGGGNSTKPLQSEELELSYTRTEEEEVDLELRLGYQPEVM